MPVRSVGNTCGRRRAALLHGDGCIEAAAERQVAHGEPGRAGGMATCNFDLGGRARLAAAQAEVGERASDAEAARLGEGFQAAPGLQEGGVG